jgi:multicomponent Na+:H+ antiporter subunit G
VILLDVLTVLLLLAGAGFYLGGTLGLLRFPDTLTRLHAPAKADNLGLGFLVAGLALQADGLAVAVKLLLVWLFTLLLAGSSAYLIGRQATKPRERR